MVKSSSLRLDLFVATTRGKTPRSDIENWCISVLFCLFNGLILVASSINNYHKSLDGLLTQINVGRFSQAEHLQLRM